jgi:hypothetical protein
VAPILVVLGFCFSGYNKPGPGYTVFQSHICIGITNRVFDVFLFLYLSYKQQAEDLQGRSNLAFEDTEIENVISKAKDHKTLAKNSDHSKAHQDHKTLSKNSDLSKTKDLKTLSKNLDKNNDVLDVDVDDNDEEGGIAKKLKVKKTTKKKFQNDEARIKNDLTVEVQPGKSFVFALYYYIET